MTRCVKNANKIKTAFLEKLTLRKERSIEDTQFQLLIKF